MKTEVRTRIVAADEVFKNFKTFLKSHFLIFLAIVYRYFPNSISNLLLSACKRKKQKWVFWQIVMREAAMRSMKRFLA